MKNIKKISVILILVTIIGLIYSNYSQAAEISNIFSSADNFLTEGHAIASVINKGQLQETSNFMYKLLLAIGIVVMFIVGTILGIQFMIASAEDKAKVKEALIPYIVGCIVIFGAFTIWSIAVNIGQDMTKVTTTQTSTTYSKDSNGTLYCDYCEDPLGPTEQRRAKCANCGLEIEGI